MEAGNGMDTDRMPRGPGTVAAVAYMKQIMTKPVCGAPVKN